MSRASAAVLLLLGILLASADPLRGQDTTGRFQPSILPSLDIKRTAGPVVIDGKLDDAGWSGAARASNFSEFYPEELARPPVETEALLAYDDENLYVAFICHDDPAAIRATLHNRDEMWGEDLVGIILDTYGDASWAYELFVNARGIQGDVLWTNSGEDTGFDLLYHSEALITEGGYQVEMAIPFNSLRFPARAIQNWRATFWRIHPRESRREYSWAGINRENPCQFCQYGYLNGIENVKPGNALELLPSAIAYQSATQKAGLPGEPSTLEEGPIKADAGLGLRYAFSPSVIAEAALNPDFSQVESDASQIDVNSTFALFYPERRPFFQEGSDLFSTWISGVYTRTINDPLVATKLTGRLGRTNLALLSAYDENTPLIIPGEERSTILDGGKTVSNIFRIRQSFAQESYVGGLITDMRMHGGSGTTFGVDMLYRFLNLFQVEWQTLASRMIEPGENPDPLSPERSARFDGESFWGQSSYLSLEGGSRNWSMDLDYWDTDRGFRALNGFVTEGGIRQFNGWGSAILYPEDSWIDKLMPGLTIGRKWNYDGQQKDEWVMPAVEMNMKGQSWMKISYLISRERFRDIQFDGIRRLDLRANTYFNDIIGGGFNLIVGRSIARNLEQPVLGRGMNLDLMATIVPMQRLNIQPVFSYANLYHPETGEEIYAGYVFRAKLNYQFTRELFLRLVLQYDAFDHSVAVEPLLTYRINPFTIFYVGSTHGFAESELAPQDFRYQATGRQLFAKFQYLLQI